MPISRCKWLLIGLLVCTPINAQIKQITGGGYQNPDGTTCVGCRLVLQLTQDATVSGTGQVVPKALTYTLDSSGNVPSNSNIWGNDQLQPLGTTYQASLYYPGGGRIWGPEFLSITGTSPINISQLSPVSSSSVLLANAATTGGNNVFTGNNTFNALLTMNGGGSMSGTFSGTPTFNGSVVFSGNPSFTGNITASGQNVISNTNTFNAAFYVGGGISTWSGSDIGAQINSAYAALPATGGIIYVLMPSSGNTYNFSTPIVMNTSGKEAAIVGWTAGAPNIYLNYTPTTGTAITMDFAGASGDGISTKVAIANLTLVNNGCVLGPTVCVTGSATGVVLGPSSSGAAFGRFENFRVIGFNTGVSITAASSWGTDWENCSITGNATGYTTSISIENTTFHACKFTNNTTALSVASGDTYIVNSSIDQSQTVGISQTGGQVYCIACHFEGQSGPSTALQAWTSTGGASTIIGGVLIDDAASSSLDNYFAFGGEAFSVNGLYVASAGRTTTTAIVKANASTRGWIYGLQNHGAGPTIYGGANAAFVTSVGSTGTSSNAPYMTQMESPIQAGGTKFGISGCSTSASAGGAWAGSYTSGTSGTCTVTITPTLSANSPAKNGFICDAHDITTPADVQNQTATNGTTATISGTTVSGDVVLFKCSAY